MRVLHVAAGMGIGGAERIVIALCGHLRAGGCEVAVAAPAGSLDGELAALGVERHRFPERGRSRTGAALSALAVARAVRAFRPDVVHGHNIKATALALAAARLSGARPVPVVASFQGVLPEEDRATARVLRRAERVACVGQELADRMLAQGVPAEKLAVVHNAVAAPAPLHPQERARLDAELSLGAALTVVAVGRLVEQKNHARLLEAAALVLAERPGVRFLIVGDGPLRAQLEARAASLGLDGAVTLTGARMDAPAVMARADLVAFASDWEGLSVAALEALAAGTPVVSTPAAGMAELLSGGAGLVAGAMSAEALATGITELLDDGERRAAMGEAGRRLVAERFSVAVMAEAYERLYTEALEARRS